MSKIFKDTKKVKKTQSNVNLVFLKNFRLFFKKDDEENNVLETFF